MVRHEIDQNADAALVRFCHQTPHQRDVSILWIHAKIIRDVVAVIAGRWVDRHEPERVYAKGGRRGGIAIVQIIQVLDQPLQITNAVARKLSRGCIGEGANKNFIEGSIAPPRGGVFSLVRNSAQG
jgi:hypothetical protein